MAWDPSVCISGRCPGCYVSGGEKMGDGEEEFCCDRFPVCADAGGGHMGRGKGVRLTENSIWERRLDDASAKCFFKMFLPGCDNLHKN